MIDNSYYVVTDAKKGNEKAYALLVKILNDNNLVAIGKVIIKEQGKRRSTKAISERTCHA